MVSGLVAFFAGGWTAVLVIPVGLGLILSAMAVTAVSSVLFPIPINLEAKRTRGAFQSGGNFKTGCASVTVIPISIAVVSVPPAALLGVAYYFDLIWLGGITAVFALIYGVALLYGGCRLAGNLLLEREPELVAAMKLPEE